MNRISPKGIVIAFLAVLAIDMVLAIGFAVIAGATAFAKDLTEQEASVAFSAFMLRPGVLSMSLFLGTLSIAVGGYIAARISKAYPYFNATVLGLVAIPLGSLLASELLWFNLAALALGVPAALFGGYLAARGVSHKA